MPSPPSLLQLGRLLPSLEQALFSDYAVQRLDDPAEAPVLLAGKGHEFIGLVTSSGVGASAALLAALPSLRVISNFGVGLDKIDLAAAKARGILVGYTPDVLNDCVADLAVALMLDVARRTAEADRFVRAGTWEAGRQFGLARQVSGARLGIVGLGRIGQTVARRVAGFEMAVRYHSRHVVPQVPWPHEPSLIELARWCDFLVVVVSGGPGTRHLIDAEVLDALGPQGFLVNVSRGTVVDEAALVAALQVGRIAGAGLDVFEAEPRVPDALKAMDRVVLLPHIASNTVETRQAMGERVLANLNGFFSGEGSGPRRGEGRRGADRQAGGVPGQLALRLQALLQVVVPVEAFRQRAVRIGKGRMSPAEHHGHLGLHGLHGRRMLRGRRGHGVEHRVAIGVFAALEEQVLQRRHACPAWRWRCR